MSRIVVVGGIVGLVFLFGVLVLNAESQVVRKIENNNSEIVKMFN